MRTVLLAAAFMLWSAAASALCPVQSPAAPQDLPLPSVPSTLRQPADRAAYVICHFWDGLDFSDTARSRERTFMEQNFSTFVSVFPHASDQARRQAVSTLLHKAEADAEAYALLADIAEKYLYEPESPVYSEEFYALFLEHFAVSDILGPYGTIRPRWQLEAVRKNRPGTIAADIRFTGRDGREGTLGQIEAPRLLLIFYDPDCDHCREVVSSLQGDPVLSRLCKSGRLKVLAVYSGDERKLWADTAPSLPAEWIVGFEPGLIYERGTYVLRRMPTLYLLDSDKRVLLKEPSPGELLSYLSR
ncbi:MAG: DUF5106 domain-containing protein [Alistipes sp.]|nr:DUF5106 domain-containing protein [Alistipes sp.]